MTFHYNLAFQLFMSVALLAGIAGGRRRVVPPQDQSTTKDEIVTVSYCDLVKDKAKFNGKSVRVRATVLNWLDGTSLYDLRCAHDGVEPVFDCKDKEECAAMRRVLDEKTDFNGDVGRVEAVLTGRFLEPPNTSHGNSRYRLMIKTIQQVNQIPRDIPWPGERD